MYNKNKAGCSSSHKQVGIVYEQAQDVDTALMKRVLRYLYGTKTKALVPRQGKKINFPLMLMQADEINSRREDVASRRRLLCMEMPY